MKTRKTPVPMTIVRGPLALTTFVEALTDSEREILQRLGTHPAARPGRPSDPDTPRPRTEAA